MTPAELTQQPLEAWRIWASIAVVGAGLLFAMVKLGGRPPEPPLHVGDLA